MAKHKFLLEIATIIGAVGLTYRHWWLIGVAVILASWTGWITPSPPENSGH